jgi:hypothetical protein
MEEASRYLARLALLNTALLGFTADGTTGLSIMPDAPCFLDTLNQTQECVEDKPFGEIVKGATFVVYENGRRQYKCGHCGKLHDRQSRAEDCRNMDLGIRPYRCLGKCGKTLWFVRPDSSLFHPY